MTKNKNSTRYASFQQESRVAKALGGKVCPNSGAGRFTKSDVIVEEASMSIECKTCMKEQASFSIRKEWIEKQQSDSFANRLSNSCVCINFGPDTPNYYVIDEKLMKFLVEKLIEENS